MATKPVANPLSADLPTNWSDGQIVAPNGPDVSLSTQHGYNYLMALVNAIATAANAINDAFPNLLDDSTILQHYGTCSTAAGTAAKAVTVTGTISTLTAGDSVRVLFANGNSAASPTLNVNNTGAIAIQSVLGTAAGADYWNAGEVVDFVYNGTAWVMVDGGAIALARGVTGRLNLNNGGTSATNAAAALYNLINGATALTAAGLAADDCIGVDDVSAKTGKKVTLANLLTFLAANGALGVETGSYVGTDDISANIAFAHTPKAVIITTKSWSPISDNHILAQMEGGVVWLNGNKYGRSRQDATDVYYARLTWDNNNNTLSWTGYATVIDSGYATTYYSTILNWANFTYQWIALY